MGALPVRSSKYWPPAAFVALKLGIAQSEVWAAASMIETSR
jgi:hypothetical protein